MFFRIFILGHVELLTKATTRILKVLSGGMQLRLPTTLITKLMTPGTGRTLLWKVMRIRVRALFQIGIS
jgi:hypothetical protein